jgi:hypothetical protein
MTTERRFKVIVHDGSVAGLMTTLGGCSHLHIEEDKEGGNQASLQDLVDRRVSKDPLVLVTGAERLTHADQRYLLTNNLPNIVLVVKRDPKGLTRDPSKRPPEKGPTKTKWMWSFYQAVTNTSEQRPTPIVMTAAPAPTPKRRRSSRRKDRTSAVPAPAMAS